MDNALLELIADVYDGRPGIIELPHDAVDRAAEELGIQRLSHVRLLGRCLGFVLHRRHCHDAADRVNLRQSPALEEMMGDREAIRALVDRFSGGDGFKYVVTGGIQPDKLFELTEALNRMDAHMSGTIARAAGVDLINSRVKGKAEGIMICELADLCRLFTGAAPRIGTRDNPGPFVQYVFKLPHGFEMGNTLTACRERIIIAMKKWRSVRDGQSQGEFLRRVVPFYFPKSVEDPRVIAHLDSEYPA